MAEERWFCPRCGIPVHLLGQLPERPVCLRCRAPLARPLDDDGVFFAASGELHVDLQALCRVTGIAPTPGALQDAEMAVRTTANRLAPGLQVVPGTTHRRPSDTHHRSESS